MKDTRMETVGCNCCGSASAEVIFVGHDYWYGLPGDFPLRRCKECGLFYVSPRPTREEIGRYYPEDYWPHNVVAVADLPTAWERWKWQRAIDKRLHIVLSHAGEPGRVLDIGCGTGNFLDNMRRLGWQTFGVEPNQRAVAYARGRFSLEVFDGELEQAQYPEGFFDLVTLWDVLEHVHDPRGTLLEIARVTKPGATLIMNIPNPEGIEARWFGPYWAGWDVPRHLNVFPQGTLWKMLAALGFSRVAITSAVHNTGGLPLSLGNWLAARTGRVGFEHPATRVVSSWPFLLVLAPYYRLLSRFNAASCMTIVARRDTGLGEESG
jgi:SAM-dependent methyltransferase